MSPIHSICCASGATADKIEQALKMAEDYGARTNAADR